ncbi:MAG TPA: hypothetical protein VN419_10160, partial [Humidesulfovibrio sp.]|uniref:hypothetical protein n=1 Tax=Humidesulfovibrio sp. TaxID=2910988 RepID=UPI002BEE982B
MQYSIINEQPPKSFKKELVLKYDGEAVVDHTIDAEFYARSVLGFGRALKKTNRFLLKMELSVNIKAEREGSWESLVEFLTSKDIQATATLMQFLSFFNLGFKDICRLPIYILKLATDVIRSGRGRKDGIRKIAKSLELNSECKENFIKLLENFDFRSAIDEMTVFLTLMGM